MTTAQRDILQQIARKLNVAALATRSLGNNADHEGIEDVLNQCVGELRAVAGEVAR